MVVATRFELATPTMSRWCSNQLSYATIIELLLWPNPIFTERRPNFVQALRWATLPESGLR